MKSQNKETYSIKTILKNPTQSKTFLFKDFLDLNKYFFQQKNHFLIKKFDCFDICLT